MEDRIDLLVREFRDALGRLYGPRLRGVFLYGSYARGEADQESDVDILVILADFERYGEEVERTGYIGANLSLKYEVSISQVFLREHEWLHGESPFLANAREEVIPA